MDECGTRNFQFQGVYLHQVVDFGGREEFTILFNGKPQAPAFTATTHRRLRLAVKRTCAYNTKRI
jgi:hypothetical protein